MSDVLGLTQEQKDQYYGRMFRELKDNREARILVRLRVGDCALEYRHVADALARISKGSDDGLELTWRWLDIDKLHASLVEIQRLDEDISRTEAALKALGFIL